MATPSPQTPWTIESNSKGTLGLALGGAGVGLLLMRLSRMHAETNRDALAAYILGLSLFGGGCVAAIIDFKITLLVHEDLGAILVRKQSRFSRSTTTLRFDEIERIEVARVGRRRQGTDSYHLNIRLRSGKVIHTGRWSFDLSEINQIASELAAKIGCECHEATPSLPTEARDMLIAGVGALAIYAIWYRMQMGPWCPAMWFGTAPPVIMLIAFFSILRIMGLMRNPSGPRG